MKKLIITSAILIISLASLAQVFIGLGLADKGFPMQVGYQHKSGLQLATGFKVPLINSSTIPEKGTNAFLYYVSTGYNVFLTGKTNGFVLTPTVGIARVQYLSTDWKQAPIYGVELGKDANMGRVFIAANYCKQAYYSVGIKMYIK